jgi:hypothetical protein
MNVGINENPLLQREIRELDRFDPWGQIKQESRWHFLKKVVETHRPLVLNLCGFRRIWLR